MINKVCISFFMLLLVMGCANQQQEVENTPEEATISEAKVEFEEVSLTVTGMT